MKQVEIAPIEQHDFAVGAPERPRAIQPGEAAPNNKDAMSMGLPHRRWFPPGKGESLLGTSPIVNRDWHGTYA